jgi:Sulfotransferase domain
MAVQYRSLIMDSARWEGFDFRPSDIVISTPPKCGTTWTQVLCAMLIFDGREFPAPLSQLSPWLDQTIRPLETVRTVYAGQQHRRFIKTHTPLDGLPVREDVTYVVVGRDPRDVMVSMEHHLANMDLERVLTLRGEAVGNDDLDTLPARPPLSEDPTERFHTFMRANDMGVLSLASVMHHLDTAWQLRLQANVVMCHYADFSADLPGEIVRLADALEINMNSDRARELAAEATLDRMRDRADDVLPNAGAIWKDDRAFFRAGSFGEWRSRVNKDDLAEYDRTVDAIASSELATWAHYGRLASGTDPAHA